MQGDARRTLIHRRRALLSRSLQAERAMPPCRHASPYYYAHIDVAGIPETNKDLRAIDDAYSDDKSLDESVDVDHAKLNGSKHKGPSADYNKDEIDSQLAKEERTITRPLQTGDTFTPKELLPITVKLLSKVDEIGGKLMKIRKHSIFFSPLFVKFHCFFLFL
ncbi:uncharacterized protein LOC113493454 [Trichoplusia ni]|uniref:Uncharacterized protein LOC113493454 n=1 Tax=Trichoplusia ni TaxID=7111 RepID=A0A7E5VG25_TRINI|nr:uncharacterized protein LOC113493454 [Trichoplusia ni]